MPIINGYITAPVSDTILIARLATDLVRLCGDPDYGQVTDADLGKLGWTSAELARLGESARALARHRMVQHNRRIRRRAA